VHFARDGGSPRWRAGTELPPVGERLQSPYDPDVHYSAKRGLEWSGYKVHLTETCDDAAAHVITHVRTDLAMQFDMSSTAGIHAGLAAKGLLPAEHFVDCAYVSADLLVSSRRDYQVSLEGPVRGVSTWQMRQGQGYDLARFAIDWEQERVTCPQGKVSVTWRVRKGGDGLEDINAQFSRSDCKPCTARPLCTQAKEARRNLYFRPREKHEALNAARARMDDPEWQERYHIRAGIEATLSQGVRAFGLRRSRYIGLAKTSLQHVCIAAAMNLSRIINWLDGQPRAKTRVTRFAAQLPRQDNSPTVSR
jgi:transposase